MGNSVEDHQKLILQLQYNPTNPTAQYHSIGNEISILRRYLCSLLIQNSIIHSAQDMESTSMTIIDEWVSILTLEYYSDIKKKLKYCHCNDMEDAILYSI